MRDYNTEERMKQIVESIEYLNSIVEDKEIPTKLWRRIWTSWKS